MRAIATFLLLTSFLSVVKGWRPYSVTFRNLTYVVPQPQIVDFKFAFTTDADDRQRINGVLNIKQTLSNPFVQLTVLLDSGNENYRLYLNKTLSICKFLDNKKINLFMGYAYDMVADNVDVPLPKRCPVVKKIYTVKNATFNEDKLPPALPEYNMAFRVTVWNFERSNRVVVADGNIIASIENIYKKKNQ